MPSELLTLKGFSYDRLFSLLKVADAGSLTEAARDYARTQAPKGTPEYKSKFNARQAQYSRQIGDLEKIFGELTDKEGRTHPLTKRGEDLEELIRLFLHSLEEFRKQDGEKVICLGANYTILAWLVSPLLPEITDAIKEYRFILEDGSSSTLVNRVRLCKLDLALVRKKAIPDVERGDIFGQEHIATHGYTLFVPRSMNVTSKDPKELVKTLPFATMNREGEFTQELRAQGIEAIPKVGCNSFGQAKVLLDTGKFAAILPDTACLVTPDAQRFPLEDMKREMYLIWNQRSIEARKIDERRVQKIAAILRTGMAAATA